MNNIQLWVNDQTFLPAAKCLVLDLRQAVDVFLQFKLGRYLHQLVALVASKQKTSWRLMVRHAAVREGGLSIIFLSSNYCISLSKFLNLRWEVDPSALKPMAVFSWSWMKPESGPELTLNQGTDNVKRDKEHEWEREKLVCWLDISETSLFYASEIAQFLFCVNH